MALLVKTVQGLAIASVKTAQGLAIASAKTICGLDNTAGGSCPADGSPSAENDANTLSSVWGAGRLYYGQSRWTDGGTPRTICKLGFKLTGATAGSSNFNATIWTNSVAPNFNLGTLQATSDVVAGSNSWNGTWVYFSFSTPFLTTANVAYALLVSPTVARASNDMNGFHDNTALPGYRDDFSAAGAASFAGGNDAGIKIYWQ